MDKKKKKLTKLSDIDVHSVGLVAHGMNNETFFLLKSNKEATMSKNDVQEPEVIEETPEVEAPEVPAIDEVQVEKTLTNVLKRMFGFNKPEEEEETPEVVPQIREQIDALQKAYDARLEVIEKQNEDLKADLEKARGDVATEREKRERASYLEKAASFMSVPVKPSELANTLFEISKKAPEQLEFIESMLDAVDAQLREAGFFSEIGDATLREDVGMLEKAQEAVKKGDAQSLKDAILSAPAAEQKSYLAEQRERARK